MKVLEGDLQDACRLNPTPSDGALSWEAFYWLWYTQCASALLAVDTKVLVLCLLLLYALLYELLDTFDLTGLNAVIIDRVSTHSITWAAATCPIPSSIPFASMSLSRGKLIAVIGDEASLPLANCKSCSLTVTIFLLSFHRILAWDFCLGASVRSTGPKFLRTISWWWTKTPYRPKSKPIFRHS